MCICVYSIRQICLALRQRACGYVLADDSRRLWVLTLATRKALGQVDRAVGVLLPAAGRFVFDAGIAAAPAAVAMSYPAQTEQFLEVGEPWIVVVMHR